MPQSLGGNHRLLVKRLVIRRLSSDPSDLDDLELDSSAPALWTSGSDNTGLYVIYPAYVGTSSACIAPLASVTVRSSETFLASVALIASRSRWETRNLSEMLTCY